MVVMEDSRRNSLEENTASAVEVEKFVEKEGRGTDGLGPKWMLWRRRRYLVVMIVLLGEITNESLRTNLSIAILPMTENRSTTDGNETTVYAQEFEWDLKTCGVVLSAFFYGFITTVIPGGIVAIKYGGSKVYGLATAAVASATLLTPAAARMHLYVLVALRIFEGMSQGFIVSSLMLLFSTWIPLEERCSLVGIVSTGVPWGAFFGISVSSTIAENWGWQAVFYLSGSVGLIWFLAWNIIVKDSPELDQKMSSSELAYIQKSLGKSCTFRPKVSSATCIKIMTSLPLWALTISFAPVNIAYVLFTTMLPEYFKDVLKQDLQNSGYITSLPLVALVAAIYCVSPVADYLINRRILTKITVRKFFICGGLTVMAVFIFLIRTAASTVAVLVCLIVAETCSGIVYSQIPVNILDLGQAYSSLMTCLHTVTNSACGMMFPIIAGFIAQNKTAEEWHTVFSILAGICLLSAVIYGLFGSAKLQPWAITNDEFNEDVQDGE